MAVEAPLTEVPQACKVVRIGRQWKTILRVTARRRGHTIRVRTTRRRTRIPTTADIRSAKDRATVSTRAHAITRVGIRLHATRAVPWYTRCASRPLTTGTRTVAYPVETTRTRRRLSTLVERILTVRYVPTCTRPITRLTRRTLVVRIRVRCIRRARPKATRNRATRARPRTRILTAHTVHALIRGALVRCHTRRTVVFLLRTHTVRAVVGRHALRIRRATRQTRIRTAHVRRTRHTRHALTRANPVALLLRIPKT